MKNREKIKQSQNMRRKARVRARIFGTADRPRLSVFRSSKHINAQLIDDDAGKTIAAANDLKLGKKSKSTDDLSAKVGVAFEVGKSIALKAKEKGIQKVVFDKGAYKYHGRIKAVADGAREGGLVF